MLFTKDKSQLLKCEDWLLPSVLNRCEAIACAANDHTENNNNKKADSGADFICDFFPSPFAPIFFYISVDRNQIVEISPPKLKVKPAKGSVIILRTLCVCVCLCIQLQKVL